MYHPGNRYHPYILLYTIVLMYTGGISIILVVYVHYLGGILHPGINHPDGILYTVLSVYIDGIYHHVVCTMLMKDINISSW